MLRATSHIELENFQKILTCQISKSADFAVPEGPVTHLAVKNFYFPKPGRMIYLYSNI